MISIINSCFSLNFCSQHKNRNRQLGERIGLERVPLDKEKSSIFGKKKVATHDRKGLLLKKETIITQDWKWSLLAK